MASPRKGKCITKTFDSPIFPCHPKEKSFDPTYFSYATFPTKHTIFGNSTFIIRKIFLRPGSSSPFLISVMSRVGLSISVYD